MTDSRKAIVLGVVSSIVAALCLPYVNAVGRLLTNAVGLTFASYNERIYEDVARGAHEHAASTVISILWCLGLSILFISGAALLLGIAIRRRGASDPPEVFRARRAAYFRGTIFGAALPLGFLMAVTTSESLFITAAVGRYEQLRTIDAPLLNEVELKELDSRFAQVRSRSDYQRIIDQLEKLARSHALYVP